MHETPFYATEEEALAAGVEEKEHDHPSPERIAETAGEVEERPVLAAAAMPIAANCLRSFHAAHHSGRRPLNVLRWIVLHDTEGGTAFTVAAYFSRPSSGGSAHLVVDEVACFRCLDNDEIPWGAPGANFRGFHIEQCAFARWSKATWLRKIKMLRRAAYKTAYHCRLFRIPPYFRRAPQLSRAVKGVTTHAECTKAFGGSHTDPGARWPRRRFMLMVRAYHVAMTRVKPIV